jgi:hypothetical protein
MLDAFAQKSFYVFHVAAFRRLHGFDLLVVRQAVLVESAIEKSKNLVYILSKFRRHITTLFLKLAAVLAFRERRLNAGFSSITNSFRTAQTNLLVEFDSGGSAARERSGLHAMLTPSKHQRIARHTGAATEDILLVARKSKAGRRRIAGQKYL